MTHDPVPEKAAPIPAEVADRAIALAAKWLGKGHDATPYLGNDIARAILADREARPSLPDSREEQIRADAARLDWLEANSNVHVQYEGWEEDVWEVYRVNGGRSDREWSKIAESSSLRDAIDLARARLGGNNG